MSIDHPHGGGEEPRKPKPAKSFNQIASDIDKAFNQLKDNGLSTRLKALDTKIRSARNDNLVKRGVTKGLTGVVTQIIS